MDTGNAKTYVQWVLGIVFVCVVFGAVASYALFQADIPYTASDFLRQYQLNKLQEAGAVETIIVGDSSAGNAIDAERWSELSGETTVNLALQGGYGLRGSHAMIQHALARHDIKTVVIIQTPDIWKRLFEEQLYAGLLHGEVVTDVIGTVDVARYTFNTNELYQYAKYLWCGPTYPQEIKNDYIPQSDERFSNGVLSVSQTHMSPGVHPSKREALVALDELCEKHELHCVYLHGPLLDDILNDSTQAMSSFNAVLAIVENIIHVPSGFGYPAEKIGDATDHIDPAYKQEVTREYFEVFQKMREDG